MTKPISTAFRINEHLQEYWYELRGDRPLPFEHEINTDLLQGIWDHCFLVSRRDASFHYAYLGNALIDAYGDDFTNHEIAETLVYPHPPSLFETFKKVCTQAIPMMDDSSFINSIGMEIRYRSCVLPLAASGRDGVAFLLGGMKWKAYEAKTD